MTGPVRGGSSSAAAAAEAARRAAEARRRAEEARRAAEAARRAEAARKAAEAARKAAEAAKKQAEAARRQAEAQKKAAAQAKKAAEAAKKTAEKPGLSPEESKKAKSAAEQTAKQEKQAAAKAAEAGKAAAEAAKKQQRAEEEVAVTAKKAEEAMTQANRIAREEKVAEPFSAKHLNEVKATKNEVASAFEGVESTQRKADLEKMLGVSAKSAAEHQKELTATKEYDRLSTDPKNRAALEQLGIKNGHDLAALGDKLEAQTKDSGGSRAGDKPDFSKVQDKEALARVIQGAGATRQGEAKELLQDKAFSKIVAEGTAPKEAKETVEAGKKLQLTEQELTNLARNDSGRNALRTLANPDSKPADRVSAGLELAKSVGDAIGPEKFQGVLGKAFAGLPSAKGVVDSISAFADPKASPEKKAKSLLTLGQSVKDFVGPEAFPKLAQDLRKLDGTARAAGAALTLFDDTAKPQDRALAALQLAGELPGAAKDLKALHDIIKEARVPGAEALISDTNKLADLARNQVDPSLARNLTPGQIASVTEAVNKVGADNLGPVLKNVTDPAAMDGMLKSLNGMDADAGKKLLTTAQSLDPKVLNEAFKDSKTVDNLAKAAGQLDAKELSAALKQVKTGEGLKALTGELAKVDAAQGNKLLQAAKVLDTDALDSVLKNADSLKNFSDVVKGLDDKGVQALAKTLKNMDKEGIDTVLKYGSKVPPEVLQNGLRLLGPVIDKVGGRAIGEGFKLLDKLVGKMGVELTGEVAGKVFKNLAKIVPAIGAVPGLVDAGLLAKESAELHGKNKDLGYLALVGSELNAVDSVGGLLLDATGVGAGVDLAAGAALGIAELAIDIGLNSEKAKMEKNPDGYEAPDWVKGVNLAASAATAPLGVAQLVGYYGPKESFELARWGLSKGGELASKAWDLLKKAGPAVAQLIPEAIEGLKNLGEKGVETLNHILQNPGDVAKETLEHAGKALTEMARLQGEVAKKAAQAIAGFVDSGADWAKDAAVNLLKDGVGAMKDVASAWANNVTDGAREVVDRLEGLGEAGVAALQELSKAGGQLAELTVDKLKGLAKAGVGVAKDALEGLGKLGGKVGDLAGDALDGLGGVVRAVIPGI